MVLPLRAHELTGCAIPLPARLDLAALGDFPIDNRSTESLSLSAQNRALALPSSTLALEASASSDASSQTYIGYSERSADRLDFVLWPRGTSCVLAQGGLYPAAAGGEAFGYAPTSGQVLLAGSNDPDSSAVVGALAFDTRTGDALAIDPRAAVLQEPRAFASVSDFGGKLLVAGGENPIHSTPEASVLRATAEVYDPTLPGFERELVQLVEPTTRHAALTLDSGETVLFGGRIEATEAAKLVQIVSPDSRTSGLLGPLRFGRNQPSALRLSDGRILVAGGLDADGAPVSALEWRSPDGTGLSAPFDGRVALPPRFGRAYAALAGGAALAVGGCEPRAPGPGEDCSACLAGCPPLPDADSGETYDAYWISAEGEIQRLEFPFAAARVTLLPGSDGRPWLVADGALYRFDAWQGRFREQQRDPELTGARFVSTGPDAFVWLGQGDASPALRGARFGTRSGFASDVALIAQRDPELSAHPAHFAPDDLRTPPSYDGALGFEDETSCASLSDALFGDFDAELDFASAAPPTLRLGETSCALPGISAESGTIHAERRGTQVTLRFADAQSTCTVVSARTSLALCGNQRGAARATRLSVTRRGS